MELHNLNPLRSQGPSSKGARLVSDAQDRKPEENTSVAILKRMEKYEAIPAHRKTEIHQLPRWVKTALVLWAVDGMTYKEAAAKHGKTGSTLANYAKSPAAKEWLASLSDFLDDPVAMAKAYLGANAMSVTLQRFLFLEAAVDAGDYKEGDKIAKDLQDRMGVMPKKVSEGPSGMKITVNLGGGSMESPVIEAEWEEVGGDGDE